MAMKLHQSSSYEKESSNNCCIWVLSILCTVLLILLIASVYLLYSCSEYKGYIWDSNNYMIDDDGVKLQLYLLETNYYLEELDKEETKISNIAKDYKMVKRYALKREPKCVEKYIKTDDNITEFETIELSTETSLKKFKKLLSNWNDNIDYMDIDKTISSLLNQYHEIYFQQGNWKVEKIDKRWEQLKEFYTNAIIDMELCTTPSEILQDDLEKINYVRNQIIKIDNELDEKLKLLYDLDKELINVVNMILPVNITCLYQFSERWESIQTEEVLAEREIQVLKFKLKQIRYKLMIADTTEKLDFLVKWEENFSNTKDKRYKVTIDNHYEKAKNLKNKLLNHINKCAEIEN